MTLFGFAVCIAMGLGAVASTCRLVAAIQESADVDCAQYRLDNVGLALWHSGMLILCLSVFILLVRS